MAGTNVRVNLYGIAILFKDEDTHNYKFINKENIYEP